MNVAIANLPDKPEKRGANLFDFAIGNTPLQSS
jgi:hypothetical protein